MSQKLIKLSDTHYIIVDNSEIKPGDFYLNTSINEILFKFILILSYTVLYTLYHKSIFYVLIFVVAF